MGMSFSSGGGSTFVNPVNGPFGSAATPTYSFSPNPDTGLFMESAPPNRMGVSVEGSNKMLFDGTANRMVLLSPFGLRMGTSTGDTGVIEINDANNAATPGLVFFQDLDTGFYRIAANWFGMATAGVARWGWDANGHYIATIDNTYDIGIAARQPRTVRVGTSFQVGANQVVSARGAAVADAAGGANIDVEARAALNALLARVRVHGLIA